jgi:hypothetical protein
MSRSSARSRRALRLVGGAGILATLAIPLLAQTPRRTRILGVFDEGGPIEGAEVVDLVTGDIARTTSTGTVSLAFLYVRRDSSVIQVRKLGYRDTAFVVLSGRADTVPITIVLARAARTTELPAVITRALEQKHRSPNMSGFEERRATAIGKFLTPAELQREAPGRRMDLVLQSHGMTSNRMGGSRCRPVVFVNGMRRRTGELPTLDDIEAVEFYRGDSTVPSQFGGVSAPCGVLVFWLKE